MRKNLSLNPLETSDLLPPACSSRLCGTTSCRVGEDLGPEPDPVLLAIDQHVDDLGEVERDFPFLAVDRAIRRPDYCSDKSRCSLSIRSCFDQALAFRARGSARDHLNSCRRAASGAGRLRWWRG